MVDEDTSQVLSDGFGKESCGDGGIDPAGEGTEHFSFFDLLSDSLNLLCDEGGLDEISFAPADIDDEVLEDCLSFDGMFDLRMELRGVDSFCGIFKRSDRTVVGMGSHRHVLRDLHDEIGMGHEDGSPLFDAFEQPGIRVNV